MSIHPAARPIEQLLSEVTITRHKGGGPGGQRRNKVETGAGLLHRPTGIRAEAGERRSFEQNRLMALKRLRLSLALRHREAVRLEGLRPSELWRNRTGGARLAVRADHVDVPALIAEALDVLAATGDDVPGAAVALGVTPSRLLRVLKLAPSSLGELNRRRAVSGLPPWR